MHEPRMVDGDRAGAGVQLARRRDVQPLADDVDGAAEGAAAVVVVDAPLVRTGQHQQRAVVRVHVVQQDADGKHALIGVRIERPVLVPLHRGAVAARLHVHLAAGAQADVGADQRLQSGHDAGMAGKFAVERMRQMRALDAAHPGREARVRRLQIEDVRVLVHVARAGGDLLGHGAQLGQRLGFQQVRNDDVAVLAVLFDLRFAQHAAFSSQHCGALSHLVGATQRRSRRFNPPLRVPPARPHRGRSRAGVRASAAPRPPSPCGSCAALRPAILP